MAFSAQQIAHQFSEWYQTPVGEELLKTTENTLMQWLSEMVGYYALELSHFDSKQHWCAKSRVRSHFLSTSLPMTDSHVVCDFAALPFDTESVDLVVAHHLFEFVDDPYAVMREIHRILIPTGKCIVIAFNPLGVYGCIKIFKPSLVIPWGGEFYPAIRVRDWLSILNFEVEQTEYIAPLGFYIAGKSKRFAWFPPLCAKCIPISGGLFALSATKRVMKPIVYHPKPRTASSLLDSKLAQPTTFQNKRTGNRG